LFKEVAGVLLTILVGPWAKVVNWLFPNEKTGYLCGIPLTLEYFPRQTPLHSTVLIARNDESRSDINLSLKTNVDCFEFVIVSPSQEDFGGFEVPVTPIERIELPTIPFARTFGVYVEFDGQLSNLGGHCHFPYFMRGRFCTGWLGNRVICFEGDFPFHPIRFQAPEECLAKAC